MRKAELTNKMVHFYGDSIGEIGHFFKVHEFAALIGKLEKLDEKTQETLEMAAIVHDIACPLCREKYGNANGNHQEAESEALLRPFLEEFELPEDVRERIIFLVTHHHTVSNIEGIDYQILIEADFLVNAAEMQMGIESIRNFRNKIVKTNAGKALFDSIYLS